MGNKLSYTYVCAVNQLRAVGNWYASTFFRRREAQDFFEYIVLVGFGIVVAGAVAGLYMAIRGKFTQAQSQIESIGP